MAAVEPLAGRHFVDSSTTREPSGYSHISATSRRLSSGGRDLELEHEDRPEHGEVVERRCPSGRAPRRTRAASFENSLRSGRSPRDRLDRAVGSSPFIDPEHT